VRVTRPSLGPFAYVIGNLASFKGVWKKCPRLFLLDNVKCSKKNLRSKWEEEDLQNAMRVVRTSKISTNAAAIHYKVPRTLRAYLAENKQSKPKVRIKTVFSPQQEKKLSKRIIRVTQTGYPITLKVLRMCVHILWQKQYSKSICEGIRNGWSCLGRGFFASSSHDCIPQSAKS